MRNRSPSRRLEPIAPSDPAGAGAGEERPPGRGRGRARKALVTLAVIGIVAVPIVLGGLIALRSVFFVGTNDQGFVTVYRGLPYDLAFGIDLYQENYVSPITRDEVPARSRRAVTEQELRSQSDAYDLVRQLELGRLEEPR